jgi:hypothetical protein
MRARAVPKPPPQKLKISLEPSDSHRAIVNNTRCHPPRIADEITQDPHTIAASCRVINTPPVEMMSGWPEHKDGEVSGFSIGSGSFIRSAN